MTLKHRELHVHIKFSCPSVFSVFSVSPLTLPIAFTFQTLLLLPYYSDHKVVAQACAQHQTAMSRLQMPQGLQQAWRLVVLPTYLCGIFLRH